MTGMIFRGGTVCWRSGWEWGFGGRVGDKRHAKCGWGALETIG